MQPWWVWSTGRMTTLSQKYLCSKVPKFLFASISNMSSCVSLLCTFSLSRIRSRPWRLFSLGCGLLWCLLSTAYGLSCDEPCNPSLQCTHIDTSNCRYGLVKDVCGCCNVCGKGLGELCGGINDIEGKCGPGFECVTVQYEGLSEAELDQIPGFCRQVITVPPVSTNETNSTASPEANSTEPAINCTSTTHQEEPTDSENCRQKCSVDYCTGRAKICSAQGLEFTKVQGRSDCQHTSCHACFLLVRPNCDHLLCNDPPKKKCLRDFYDCVREHYFSGASNETLLLKLEDARSRSLSGRVICHVPSLQTSEQ